eukprot:3708371-Pyramimonas_sp.AAC.1
MIGVIVVVEAPKRTPTVLNPEQGAYNNNHTFSICPDPSSRHTQAVGCDGQGYIIVILHWRKYSHSPLLKAVKRRMLETSAVKVWSTAC